MKVERRTVDLAAYPDLVVIYLGMRANALTGIKTLVGFGPRISDDLPARIGLSAFAPIQPARGPMFSARTRLKTGGTETKPIPVSETELYSGQ